MEASKRGSNVTWVQDSAALPEPLSLGHPTGGSTILVVDDNPGFLKAMTEAIDNGKRRIVAVREAGSAIDLLAGRPGEFDILLTDLHLRRGREIEYGGDDLCTLAKRMNPRTRTILFSGDISDANLRSVDHMLRKEMGADAAKVNDAILRDAVAKAEAYIRKARI
jgi:CheY-like chemotaxis protein